ncbi:hypothetical protein L6164_006587 [Bauhinia variegata]|uniref:Uncharacterized protein n=1 Tax=Bauhinia variegata TaxID=167791 RepID=A0ACB9PUX9_BAUVA|nr:hypothetical protein L6164_006587 [Bauhinia variegata]
MDSFKQHWSSEGCSSSESGWTMYIASPTEEDDDGRCINDSNEYDDVYSRNRKQKQGKKVEDAESDDSLASDASSGPIIHHEHSRSSHGAVALKRDKMDQGSKCSSRKNGNKQEKKRVDSRSKK